MSQQLMFSMLAHNWTEWDLDPSKPIPTVGIEASQNRVVEMKLFLPACSWNL